MTASIRNVREVEHPRLRDLWAGLRPSAPVAAPHMQPNSFALTGSGKNALALILRWLRATGRLPDKMHELAMPQWLGTWVYAQVTHFALPGTRLSERTRALLAYHQYGFPQDMDRIRDVAADRKCVLIEDCAHALAGQYKGAPLGTLGDFAVYSFSKYFFCFALGGVRWTDPEFASWLREAQGRPQGFSRAWISLTKLLSEWALRHPGAARLNQAASMLLDTGYALYGACDATGSTARALFRQKADAEIALRERRYAWFRKEVDRFGVCDPLEERDVCPYVIPVFVQEDRRETLVARLRAAGFRTGVYRFDVNRFFLEPRFVPCVWFLCHGGISDAQFEQQASILKGCI